MTTAVTAKTVSLPQENSPALTSSEILHLIDDSILSCYLRLAYQPAITSEDQEITDQMFLGAAGGPFQERGRCITSIEPSALTILRWMRRDKAIRQGGFDTDGLFIQGAASVVAEPISPIPLKIIGEGSSLPEAYQFLAEAATDLGSLSHDLDLPSKLDAMFAAAKEETFADGMDSDFSSNLHSIVNRFGDLAINAISRLIRSERFDVEVVGEVLRQFGYINHPQSLGIRLAVLLQALESTDPRIRDAASIGIAAMDDPIAIEGIRRATEREGSQQLRHNLQLVLDQLEKTEPWRTS